METKGIQKANSMKNELITSVSWGYVIKASK
jgi:hypothetical protein